MIGGVNLEPFYRPLGDGRFHATFSTTGPWFADVQHVGPPSALLVRALEGCDDRPGTRIARVTVEVLGPVPAGEVAVSAQVERPGRGIALLGAEMTAAGRPVLRARAWRLATGDTAVEAGGAAPPLPSPESATPRADKPDGWLPGFIDALEWRWVSGWLGEPGPGVVWTRPRVPLVEGEQPSALQRLMLVADSGNGAAAPLDIRAWLFVNTELTVHVHRASAGAWLAVDAATAIGPDGVGTVAGVLHDAAGAVGRSAQCLVVRRR